LKKISNTLLLPDLKNNTIIRSVVWHTKNE